MVAQAEAQVAPASHRGQTRAHELRGVQGYDKVREVEDGVHPCVSQCCEPLVTDDCEHSLPVQDIRVSAEVYIHFLDRFGMEVHFTRYLYFAIAGGDS